MVYVYQQMRGLSEAVGLCSHGDSCAQNEVSVGNLQQRKSQNFKLNKFCLDVLDFLVMIIVINDLRIYRAYSYFLRPNVELAEIIGLSDLLCGVRLVQMFNRVIEDWSTDCLY